MARSFSVVSLLVCCAASMVEAVGPVPTTERSPGDEWTALVLPQRRLPDAPPAHLPALPPLGRITPLTLDVVIQVPRPAGKENGNASKRWPSLTSPATVRRRVSRTADRVHVLERDGREWLFEQNVRDPRRVSGFFVDHSERVIVVYDESALRNTQGIRGWTDVLTLGFDPDQLRDLEPDAKARIVAGRRFVHYTSRRNGIPVRDVRWNAAEAFPSDVVTSYDAGSVRLRVEHARPGVDVALLQPPSSRFPAYRVVELADHLER